MYAHCAAELIWFLISFTSPHATDQVTVLVGPPALHAALATDRSQGLVDLTTIWISLQSKDVFVQKASDLVKAQVGFLF